MGTDLLIAGKPDRKRVNNGLLYTGVLTLLIVALYINVAKVVIGSRYIVLLADSLTFLLAGAAITIRLQALDRIMWIEVFVGSLLLIGALEILNPNVPDVMTGVEGFRRLFFQLLAVYVGSAIVKTRLQLITIFKVLAWAAVPILLYGVKQFFWISGFDERIIAANTADADTWRIFSKIRAFGVFNGPFHLGLFSGFSFWLAVGLYSETRRRRYILLGVLAVAACLSTLTRSSLVALIASLPIVLIYVYRSRRVRVAVGTAALLVAGFLSLMVLRTTFENVDFLLDSISSLNSIEEDSRLQTRFDGYSAAITAMTWNVFGFGSGSAADAMGDQFEPHSRQHFTSHNLFLRVGIEVGWLGFLAFVGILIQIALAVRTFKRRRDYVPAVILGGWLIILFIAGVTGSCLGAYPVNLIFWLVAGSSAGYLAREAGWRSDVS